VCGSEGMVVGRAGTLLLCALAIILFLLFSRFCCNRLLNSQSLIRLCLTPAGKVHRLWRATGDKNVSQFFVSFLTKLNALQRLRHLTGEPLVEREKPRIFHEIKSKEYLLP